MTRTEDREGDATGRESPTCCYSRFSAFFISLKSVWGPTASFSPFFSPFFLIQPSPFNIPHPSLLCMQRGKNADSTVIIQLDLLMGTVQAVLNSLPTKDKEILSMLIVSSLILIYQCDMQGCWQFTEEEGDALIHLNSGLPVTLFPDV